jgi:hypothetical protein
MADPVQVFLDTYFKMHAQRTQAQQFAQELQLRQATQQLEAQKFGFEQQKTVAEQKIQRDTLQNAIDKLNFDKSKQDQDMADKAEERKRQVADLLNTPGGKLVPNTDASAPGAMTISGIGLRPLSPAEQSQNASDAAAELERQKGYTDLENKLTALRTARAQLPEGSPLKEDDGAWGDIVIHALTGVPPPIDRLNASYTKYLERYQQARHSGDPVKIKAAQDDMSAAMSAARPFLEATHSAQMGELGLKLADRTAAQNDSADMLQMMADSGFDDAKAKPGEYEAAVATAATMVNAQRRRDGKVPVDPRMIQLLNNLHGKQEPGKGNQLLLPPLNINVAPPAAK